MGVAEKMKVYIDEQEKSISMNASMERLMKEHVWYVNKFGLSPQTRRKIEESLERIRALPTSSDDDSS